MGADEEDELEGDDTFYFFLYLTLSPVLLFAFETLLVSIHLDFKLWRPFWSEFTETVHGRVTHRGEACIGYDSHAQAIYCSTVTIEYNPLYESDAHSPTSRTFLVPPKRDWSYMGRPHVGQLSFETYRETETLPMRIVPDYPSSAIPERDWELHQKQYSWSFYFYILSFVCLSIIFFGVGIMWLHKRWAIAEGSAFFLYYMAIGRFARKLCFKNAMYDMDRQRTRLNFTLDEQRSK